jgi:hypothetical protein
MSESDPCAARGDRQLPSNQIENFPKNVQRHPRGLHIQRSADPATRALAVDVLRAEYAHPAYFIFA